MTDWREELIGKMADAMFASDENGTLRVDVMALAALAVAEPVIREQAENALREENARLREALEGWQKWWALPWQDRRPDTADVCWKRSRAAIREGGNDE